MPLPHLPQTKRKLGIGQPQCPVPGVGAKYLFPGPDSNHVPEWSCVCEKRRLPFRMTDKQPSPMGWGGVGVGEWRLRERDPTRRMNIHTVPHAISRRNEKQTKQNNNNNNNKQNKTTTKQTTKNKNKKEIVVTYSPRNRSTLRNTRGFCIGSL